MKKLFLVLAIFLLSACSKATVSVPVSPTPVSTSTPKQETGMFSGSLLDMLGMSDSKKCTLKIETESKGTVDGIYYISAGKVRGNMKTTGEGITSKTTPIEMNTIVDKDTMYMWMEKPITFGTKVNMEKMKQMGKDMPSKVDKAPKAPAGAPDLNIAQKYSCEPWVANPSMFMPPANINFKQNF